MECITIKNGSECVFMTRKGCNYKSGVCYEIIDNCKGCERSSKLSSGWYCMAFPEPALKWKHGNCNLATHTSSVKVETKSKINPIKASKRANR